MKLFELTHEDPLSAAQRELDDLKRRAGFIGQGVIAPQYKNQYDRLVHQIATIKAERKAAKQAEFAQAASRDYERDFVVKRSTETPEQKRIRRGDSIRAGLKAAREYRDDKTRDYATLAQKVHDIVMTASNGGAEKVTTDVIAHHFPNVASRTIDKWLERPEFRKTRLLMDRG